MGACALPMRGSAVRAPLGRADARTQWSGRRSVQGRRRICVARICSKRVCYCAGRRDRVLGAQIGILRVHTHPSQTLEFLVKVHRAQERALHRAGNMTQAQLTVEDAEHDMVDQLLDDFTVLRLAFYEHVENATARAQSSRGSRKGGEDSEDELSAGVLEHDDEE